jgi:integrase
LRKPFIIAWKKRRLSVLTQNTKSPNRRRSDTFELTGGYHADMKIERKFRKDLNAWRWGFDVTIMGQRIRRYEWPLKRDAKDALAALQTRARAHRYGLILPEPIITLQDLQHKLMNDKSLVKRKPLLATFEEFLEAVDRLKPLKELTRADWKIYLTRLETRDLKPGTINHYLGRVSSALNKAGDYFPSLSEWRPPSAPWTSEPPGRDRVLSKEEVSKILDALRSPRQKFEQDRSVAHRHEIYDLFRLMLLTAAREGEVLALTHRAVSWDWKTVQIEATKTNTRRVIPLSAAALEILQSRKKHAPRFFKRISHYGLYMALDRAGKVAGVKYGGKVDGGWIIYDVRHLAATVMENSGIPYSAVAAILGHKRKDQTATYTHVQMETMRRGVEVLEKHCRGIDGFFSISAEEQGDAQTILRSAER